MGGQCHSVYVFLVSVSIFIISAAATAATAGAPGQQPQPQQPQPLATIHVMNAMPKGSPPMQLRCNSIKTYYAMTGVGVGEDYECDVKERSLYYCAALSGRQIASWHAFQPRRDRNHKAVFWLVKAEGFFLSWDNSTWVKKSVWYTE